MDNSGNPSHVRAHSSTYVRGNSCSVSMPQQKNFEQSILPSSPQDVVRNSSFGRRNSSLFGGSNLTERCDFSANQLGSQATAKKALDTTPANEISTPRIAQSTGDTDDEQLDEEYQEWCDMRDFELDVKNNYLTKEEKIQLRAQHPCRDPKNPRMARFETRLSSLKSSWRKNRDVDINQIAAAGFYHPGKRIVGLI